MAERDPELEARRKLEQKLEKLSGWEIVKPVPYSNENDLYNWIYETWEDYWDPPDSRYFHIVSSVTMLARRWTEFEAMAHLFLYGPKHSGKGQALKLFQQLTPKPLLFSSIKPAGIYQTVDSLHPTMLMDECDRLGTERSEYVDEMLQVLNVYEKNEFVIRASREGSAIKLYDLFCLKILAGQNPLPGSLPDRTIRLDMEKNIKDIPIDIEIDERLRGQLEYYGARHSEHKGLTKEQLKSLIGDNRVTQLYYPLYVSCPSPQGQKTLIELAVEQLDERDQEESYGDLAEVTERLCEELSKTTQRPVSTVLTDATAYKPVYIELSELTRTPFETMPKGRDVNRWLGWRLKKLQMKRERPGHVRYVVVNPRVLLKKARRYAPYLLKTGQTGETGQ